MGAFATCPVSKTDMPYMCLGIDFLKENCLLNVDRHG